MRRILKKSLSLFMAVICFIVGASLNSVSLKSDAADSSGVTVSVGRIEVSLDELLCMNYTMTMNVYLSDVTENISGMGFGVQFDSRLTLVDYKASGELAKKSYTDNSVYNIGSNMLWIDFSLDEDQYITSDGLLYSFDVQLPVDAQQGDVYYAIACYYDEDGNEAYISNNNESIGIGGIWGSDGDIRISGEAVVSYPTTTTATTPIIYTALPPTTTTITTITEPTTTTTTTTTTAYVPEIFLYIDGDGMNDAAYGMEIEYSEFEANNDLFKMNVVFDNNYIGYDDKININDINGINFGIELDNLTLVDYELADDLATGSYTDNTEKTENGLWVNFSLDENQHIKNRCTIYEFTIQLPKDIVFHGGNISFVNNMNEKQAYISTNNSKNKVTISGCDYHISVKPKNTAISTYTTTTTTTTTTNNNLQLDKTSITLKNGEQYQISANQNNLTYKSNNTDAVVVSKSGLVTAIGEGDAIISVINSDGDVAQLKVKVISANGISGDLNQDNVLTIADAVIFQRYILGTKTLTYEQLIYADFTKDGIVNIFDLSVLKYKLFS